MSEVQGIKLFGQTIVLQVKKEELPTSKNDDKKASTNDQQQLPSNKRPDKVIACPRCKSMETKFCYFNNYNVNQPRHFCKGCQRYWTAGGALRNVPVGAGRRKNKPAGRPESGCWLDDEMNMAMNGVMMVDEWHLAAAMVAGFQLKRRRNESPTQTC